MYIFLCVHIHTCTYMCTCICIHRCTKKLFVIQGPTNAITTANAKLHLQMLQRLNPTITKKNILGRRW